MYQTAYGHFFEQLIHLSAERVSCIVHLQQAKGCKMYKTVYWECTETKSVQNRIKKKKRHYKKKKCKKYVLDQQ